MLMFFLVPVIIQPDLTDRYCFRQFTKLPDLLKCLLCHLIRIIRMDSKCTIDKRIFFHKRFCVLQTFKRSTGIDDSANSVFLHGTQEFLSVRLKSLVIIMSMCFKNHIYSFSSIITNSSPSWITPP